ncbi:hypothetical protein [Candidatus Phytoplasma pini]|uniref:Phenylalanyl-tRNA synthetase beta chain n=1 Tax=Candidatus Phytoplasma pini TaxID=267362 RepID=A0A559KIZ7_9MOLU|nr:hypothetical protein [Candidatus Phytoplasma pini]TVY12079.1 Phenylalanyl-tRNA synthetase beta chain [Candidatus Phytoplasma pini]
MIQDTYYHNLHPSKQAHIYFEKERIGFIGEINPSLCREFHLQKSFILEISLQKILNQRHKQNIFQEISRFPFITRDLSFWVAKKYNFQEFWNFFQTNKFPFLVKYELVDLYQDDKINSQQYSLSFRLIFSNTKRNLENKEIKEIMTQIENKIKEKYQINVR